MTTVILISILVAFVTMFVYVRNMFLKIRRQLKYMENHIIDEVNRIARAEFSHDKLYEHLEKNVTIDDHHIDHE